MKENADFFIINIMGKDSSQKTEIIIHFILCCINVYNQLKYTHNAIIKMKLFIEICIFDRHLQCITSTNNTSVSAEANSCYSF